MNPRPNQLAERPHERLRHIPDEKIHAETNAQVEQKLRNKQVLTGTHASESRISLYGTVQICSGDTSTCSE